MKNQELIDEYAKLPYAQRKRYSGKHPNGQPNYEYFCGYHESFPENESPSFSHLPYKPGLTRDSVVEWEIDHGI
jgi:hypothetical protein